MKEGLAKHSEYVKKVHVRSTETPENPGSKMSAFHKQTFPRRRVLGPQHLSGSHLHAGEVFTTCATRTGGTHVAVIAKHVNVIL